ncbi:hypothetical protein H5410_015501 [Solanum commersonii]|uniref:Uncharacterized protein n=1 Tax=Solanum commersonii TaxID=4109 RepID=A0A9J5ZTP2_SOLCO|nr:hypothetical protein H5410_015501 [Solanum commersonii]
MAVVESGSNDTGCGTHFLSKQFPNGNFAFTVESEISFPIRFHICGEAFGDRSRRKRSHAVSWSTRGRLSSRLWLSLVRLSMFRHLFIDFLEYGEVRVLSMLNFYSSCLRPCFGKVLDYDSMSLNIIKYPYLVVYTIILI